MDEHWIIQNSDVLKQHFDNLWVVSRLFLFNDCKEIAKTLELNRLISLWQHEISSTNTQFYLPIAMGFHTLSRREFQALCKRNKILANITNVAMASALAALPSVEVIKEFLNGERFAVPESSMKEEFVSSEIPQIALRTSTREKAVKGDTMTTYAQLLMHVML